MSEGLPVFLNSANMPVGRLLLTPATLAIFEKAARERDCEMGIYPITRRGTLIGWTLSTAATPLHTENTHE